MRRRFMRCGRWRIWARWMDRMRRRRRRWWGRYNTNRRACGRMRLPGNAESLAALLKSKLIDDAEPLVRKQALLALSEMPVADAGGAAVYQVLAGLPESRRSARGAPRAAAPKAGADALPEDTGLED